MATIHATTDRDQLVDRDTAAKELAVKKSTLEAWAARGRGPKFIKVGKAVRYRLSDLDEWLASRTVDPGAATDAA